MIIINNYKSLVIIGNGFDLHLGMKTSYYDFRDYLQNIENNFDILALIEYAYEGLGNLSSDATRKVSLWSDFEENLSKINTDEFITGWGKEEEDVLDVEFILGKMYEFLYSNFRRWVVCKDIEIKNRTRGVFSKNSCYINFNYTSSLEKWYNVKRKNIFYIHGEAREHRTIVLGHSGLQYKDEFLEDYQAAIDMETIGSAYGKINRLVLDYILKISKNYKRNLDRLKTWLRDNKSFYFRKIEQVYILGHSISNVDYPYYRYLLRHLPKACIWKVSFYDDNEKSRKFQFLKQNGIKYFELREIEAYMQELQLD